VAQCCDGDASCVLRERTTRRSVTRRSIFPGSVPRSLAGAYLTFSFGDHAEEAAVGDAVGEVGDPRFAVPPPLGAAGASGAPPPPPGVGTAAGSSPTLQFSVHSYATSDAAEALEDANETSLRLIVREPRRAARRATTVTHSNPQANAQHS